MKSNSTQRNAIYIISTILATIVTTITIVNFLTSTFLCPLIDKRITEKIEPIEEKINILFIYNREIAKSDTTYIKIWNNAVKEVKNDLTLK